MMKKCIIVCWIISALSIIAFLVTSIAMINTDNWNEAVSSVYRTINQITRSSFTISLVIGLLLKIKINKQKTKETMQTLEKEVERLKSNSKKADA